MTRPTWLARTVFYQIDVPSFHDANGDGIGDLDGIGAKLDYLVDLGVNALSLGPTLLEAGGADADGLRFDPSCGNAAAFDALTDAAHARDIRVCVEWTAPAPHERFGARTSVPSDLLQRSLRLWFERGVDAVHVVGADGVVASDPYKVELRALWRELRGWVDATYRDRALIAEFGHPEIAIDAGFDVDVARPNDATGWQTLLFGPETFPAARGDAYFGSAVRGDFRRFLEPFEFQRRRIGDGAIGIPSSTRDVGRICQGRDADDLKVLFTFLLTWPHVPFIRYGDEIGMRYVAPLTNRPGGAAAGSRTAMQWDASSAAGFTRATPRVPVDPAPDRPTVAALRAQRESLWHHVERLVYLRITESDFAADAALTPLGAPDGHPLVYRRGANLIVALNPGLSSHVVALPPLGDAAPVFEHHCHVSHGADGWQLKIGSRGYGVFTVR
ncbi:MAG TPA: alpha-amylase family glycosyl hydrolase [Pseudomonadales bacterium]|nr:alpha-amylase family glycosyl hydrolase [Pseudomonadales bacterium]